MHLHGRGQNRRTQILTGYFKSFQMLTHFPCPDACIDLVEYLLTRLKGGKKHHNIRPTCVQSSYCSSGEHEQCHVRSS